MNSSIYHSMVRAVMVLIVTMICAVILLVGVATLIFSGDATVFHKVLAPICSFTTALSFYNLYYLHNVWNVMERRK